MLLDNQANRINSPAASTALNQEAPKNRYNRLDNDHFNYLQPAFLGKVSKLLGLLNGISEPALITSI